jgi:hypothetical protein
VFPSNQSFNSIINLVAILPEVDNITPIHFLLSPIQAVYQLIDFRTSSFMVGENNVYLFLPCAFDEYIAMSAFLISSPDSSPSIGK